MAGRFVVETLTTSGWENVWAEEDGTPTSFLTEDAANEELKEHLDSLDQEGMEYDRDEFRIAPANH